jgi:hypothetical protein
MDLRSPVKRLIALTSATALVDLGLLIIGSSLGADSAARNLVMVLGALVFLATLGFAWALASSLVAARRTRS